MVSVLGVKRPACSMAQKGQGCTPKSHVHFITNSPTVASQTDPVSPVHMARASQMTGGNPMIGQASTQPKL